MKVRTAVALALATGVGLGAAGVQTLHAQAKPLAYAVVETDVLDNEKDVKEYAPKAQALSRAKGAKVIAASSSVATLEGQPAKRVALLEFENMDKLKGWHGSPEFKENRRTGDKLAKFRILAVDGTPR